MQLGPGVLQRPGEPAQRLPRQLGADDDDGVDLVVDDHLRDLGDHAQHGGARDVAHVERVQGQARPDDLQTVVRFALEVGHDPGDRAALAHDQHPLGVDAAGATGVQPATPGVPAGDGEHRGERDTDQHHPARQEQLEAVREQAHRRHDEQRGAQDRRVLLGAVTEAAAVVAAEDGQDAGPDQRGDGDEHDVEHRGPQREQAAGHHGQGDRQVGDEHPAQQSRGAGRAPTVGAVHHLGGVRERVVQDEGDPARPGHPGPGGRTTALDLPVGGLQVDDVRHGVGPQVDHLVRGRVLPPDHTPPARARRRRVLGLRAHALPQSLCRRRPVGASA